MQYVASLTLKGINSVCSTLYASTRSTSTRSAFINPVINSDSDVDTWLSEHSPDAHTALKIEMRKIDDQVRRELSASSPVPAASFPRSIDPHEPFPCVPERHWAGRILCPFFPGAGSKEICDLVRPLLAPVQWAILEGSFSQGLTYEAMCPGLGITVRRVKHHAACLRQALTKLAATAALALPASAGSNSSADSHPCELATLHESPALPLQASHSHPQQRDWYDAWKALQQQRVSVYHAPPARPSARAIVCFCGRHLNTHDHLRCYKVKTLKCDYCGTSHAQGTWKNLTC